jgi:predicted SAM-dependent methyltransferase
VSIKLHLGCGNRYLPGYIHIDINDSVPFLDYCTTIDDLSMFEDNSVDEIYNCGVIGYYDREQVEDLLTEWNRVLKKDGVLRISVVDFEKQVQLYLKSGLDSTGVLGPIYGKWGYYDKSGQKCYVYKKTSYDYDSLKSILEKQGFADYSRYSWKDFLPENYDDYSAAYVPHKDESGTHIMLNIECKKC